MEEFFQLGSKFDVVELLDLLLHEYGDIAFCMRLSAEEFIELCLLADEKRKQRLIREQWVAMLPFMSLKMLEYMSLEDYTNKVTGKNIDLRSDAEILKEVAEIEQNFAKGEN